MDNDIHHELTDEAVCPHCGHTFDSSWEFADDAIVDCDICNGVFRLTRNTSITYTTAKYEETDDDDNDAEDSYEEEEETEMEG